MIPTTIEIPSEYNKYNLIGEYNKPFITSSTPFEFFSEDECGVLTAYDITSYTFVINVYNDQCLVDSLTNLIVVDTNKLFINETTLNITPGEYPYKVDLIGANTVISGKLTVK